eukprot:CAMPEP_0176268728 /NCGR_PEP_ID=MMETSP0121_2-20121125/43824_1 /TAXON_ID=160619 /ORGANISM="Kryptoperidinium foliaceum, Strain CCMP 1326" /LENGTH=69 /DNA_ID=CAMNT_0017608831 /DNA_START=118 /DNA_END=323 /DNA_ORIENTATION=-
MDSQLMADLPLHAALVACGAFGYYATKWANQRLVRPRMPLLKAKVIEEDPSDAEDDAEAPAEPECEPSA